MTPDVAGAADTGHGCRHRLVCLVGDNGRVHVASQYDVYIVTAKGIVDHMFGKVKEALGFGCDYFWCMAREALSLRRGVLLWFLHQK